ncbi:MAG: LysM peptidoglycan-binding domain-containing protein [Candidatus Doudnabacteria bacterium]|nr:LysM peptidoglycan-binding domain-containing protein [Candidatus Doudnabacteria bacterium]
MDRKFKALSPRARWAVRISSGAVLMSLLLMGMCSRKETPQPNVPNPAPQAHHVVRRGEFLKSIAPQYRNVSWESILLANEPYLKGKYLETCEPFSASYTNNSRRRGLFCNDRFHRPYGNTLKPGWTLAIPAGTAPQDVEQTVKDYTDSGDDVSIVIDDSGSMAEDRRTVAQFYLAALQKHGRNIEAVYLYVDGSVRRLEVPKDIESEMHTSGNIENTYEALRTAAGDRPDKIILITDEPGDDWPADFGGMKLPPVIATCLADHGYHACESTLMKVAKVTHGKYVAYR